MLAELIPIYRDNLTDACGAKRDRTANLQNANLALSQLSYSPGIIIELKSGSLIKRGPKWSSPKECLWQNH